MTLNPFKAFKNWRERKKSEREEQEWQLFLRRAAHHYYESGQDVEDAHYACGDKD